MGSLFSTSSPAFIVCRLLDSSHSDQHEMVPHCGFDLHFSDNEWCWASFHVNVSSSHSTLYATFCTFFVGFFSSCWFCYLKWSPRIGLRADVRSRDSILGGWEARHTGLSGSLFLNQGLNSWLLQWKHQVLTTETPGNSLYLSLAQEGYGVTYRENSHVR